MRWMLFLAYGVLLFLGYQAIVERPEPGPAGWKATRGLEKNHLLRPGDIIASGGGYTTRDIPAGQELGPGDVASTPDLTLDDTQMAITVSVAPDLKQGTINAGAAVRLCKDKNVVFQVAKVGAVLCPSQGKCTAFVVFPAKDAEKVAPAFAATPLPTLELVTKSQPCE